MKNLYDVLGLPTTAKHDEIVAAYRLRTKVLHPDRLDPIKQRAEWELANELLKELNQAYATLRDPSKRAAYDRSCGFAGSGPKVENQSAPRPAAASAPRPPPPTSIVPNLSAGHALFRNLSTALKQRLIDRQSGRIKQQFRIYAGGVGWSYLVAVACCLCTFAIVVNSAQERWDNDTQSMNIALSLGVVVLLPVVTFQIVRFHLSPLKRMLFVTPLYFMETRFDEVWFWPIWHVQGVNATHRYYNGVYYGTDIIITFPKEKRRYRVRQESGYKSLADTLRVFTEKAIQADLQQDRQYFRDEDDFYNVNTLAIGNSIGRQGRSFLVASVVGLAAAGLFLGSFTINQNAPKRPPVRLGTTSPSASKRTALNKTRPDLPPVDPDAYLAGKFDPSTAVPAGTATLIPYDRSKDPKNGFVYKNSLRNGNGTLKIQNGTSYHAVAKLVNAASNRSVFTVFVGAGEEFTIRNIPDGGYRLAFALGRRWNWIADGFEEPRGSSVFRDTMRFETTFADQGDSITTYFHNFEVTLQPVVNGNAQTDVVTPNVFESY